MIFTKSLINSLQNSHHKLSVIGTLLLLTALNFRSEQSGNQNRRIIQKTLHQTE